VPLRLLFSILVFSSLAFAGTFDKPLSKKVVDLSRSRPKPQDQIRAKVTCYYFPGFMVKEVDMGEKGAERLAIVPGSSASAPCTRARSQTEKVIKDWSGYVKGVKGNLVFFDADDGWNGGMGFVVYDAKTMKRLFEDVAQGDLKFSGPGTPKVTLRYMRVVDAECDVTKEQATCWPRIQKKFGLETLAAPDCNAGYEKSAQELAKGRCQAQSSDNPQCLAKEIELARRQTSDAASVIAYPVEVVLSPKSAIKTVSGSVGCWPSD
jgi:hypothetical protein